MGILKDQYTVCCKNKVVGYTDQRSDGDTESSWVYQGDLLFVPVTQTNDPMGILKGNSAESGSL